MRPQRLHPLFEECPNRSDLRDMTTRTMTQRGEVDYVINQDFPNSEATTWTIERINF